MSEKTDGVDNNATIATFMRDSTLFRDVSHLNDKGAKLYTQLVIKEVKNNE